MKKVVIASVFCLFSLSCLAQQTEKLVKITEGYTGKSLPYITETTFENITINGSLKLATVLKPNSINEIIEILGKPKDINHEKDTAIDGTILFERKFLIYPGLRFLYPLHENFVVSTIEFTSDNYYLCLGKHKLYVGMPIEEVKNLLPKFKAESLNNNGTIGISVAQEGPSGKVKKKADGSVSIGFENINIEYNSVTGKVTKLSITIRYI